MIKKEDFLKGIAYILLIIGSMNVLLFIIYLSDTNEIFEIILMVVCTITLFTIVGYVIYFVIRTEIEWRKMIKEDELNENNRR